MENTLGATRSSDGGTCFNSTTCWNQRSSSDCFNCFNSDFFNFGTSILSSDNRGVELVWPPAYDLPQPEQQSASRLIDITEPGGTVSGPENLDFSVSVMTTKVRSINPRSAYLNGRHVNEEFRADERFVLSKALETGRAEYGTESVENALRVLQPDTVCLKNSNEEEIAGV